MSIITLDKIIQCLVWQTPVLSVPLDEKPTVEVEDNDISFNTDAYLVFKLPSGGEVYSRLYLDGEVSDTGLSVDLNDDPLALRLEGCELVVDGKVHATDDLFNDFHDTMQNYELLFNPEHKDFNDYLKAALINQAKKQLIAALGCDSEAESIKTALLAKAA